MSGSPVPPITTATLGVTCIPNPAPRLPSPLPPLASFPLCREQAGMLQPMLRVLYKLHRGSDSPHTHTHTPKKPLTSFASMVGSPGGFLTVFEQGRGVEEGVGGRGGSPCCLHRLFLLWHGCQAWQGSRLQSLAERGREIPS